METNPTVEPDAPLPSDETTPQTTPTDNPPPEPAGTPVSEIAAEAAAAEGLPEPLVEVAEQTEQAAQPEPSESAEPQGQQEEGTTEPGSAAAPEESPQESRKEGDGEAQAAQSELDLHGKAEAPEETQAEAAQSAPAGEGEEPRPEGEAPQEAPAEGTLSEASQDALAELATRAQTARLSPTDEERAVTLLKEALLDGRAGVVRAIEALQKLPWVIGVNAVTAVWPEMKAPFRSQMLAGLVRANNDAARRMRLSLARGLFKQDVPIALKIVVGASREMRDRETGAMNARHAQIFANVLIGRAKPWIAQLPLSEVKPNDADILVHCALLSAFSLPHAPITQLGIIKWAAEAGRLAKLQPIVIEAAQKSLGRWSGKWQNALRKEVADLPEGFTSVLKVTQGKEAGQQPPAEGAEHAATEETPQPAGPVEPDAETEAAEVVPEDRREPAEEPDAEPAEAPKAEGEAAEERGEAPAGQPKQRPVYESKTVPRKQQQQGQAGQQPQQQLQQPQQGGKGGPALKEAGVPELLRQLESQFQHLRSELNTTQSKLRQRDEELRRAQKRTVERAAAPIIEGEPTPEELARLNRQLENRNQELQARIEELLADSEARAVSVGAVSGEPVNDPNAQLRTLLGLKIQEDYEDFLALEKESPDIVVQQHYRTVLRHVFEVLTQEGVQFDLPKHEGM